MQVTSAMVECDLRSYVDGAKISGVAAREYVTCRVFALVQGSGFRLRV